MTGFNHFKLEYSIMMIYQMDPSSSIHVMKDLLLAQISRMSEGIERVGVITDKGLSLIHI